MLVLKYLDLVILAIALPIFLVAGWPMLGYAAGAVAWLVQRAIHDVLARRAAASDDPTTVVGLMAGSMIGRGWLVALTIFAAGMAGATTRAWPPPSSSIVLFTVYFTVSMILRPFEKPEQPASDGPSPPQRPDLGVRPRC